MARSATRTKSSASLAERQANKLLNTVSKTLHAMGTKVGRAANAAAKRKYVVAGLAALVVAGAAAQRLTSTLRSPAHNRQRPRKATRRSRPRGRRARRHATAAA